MNEDTTKFLCLCEELKISRELIKAGFGGLQEIDMSNDFYHLPHQLLASGFERLMKCYISLVYEGEKGSYPDMGYPLCMRALWLYVPTALIALTVADADNICDS